MIKRADRKISLTPTEYNLLEYLALNYGRVVGRSEIRDHIYDEAMDRDSNVIDVYINFLRGKMDKGFDRQVIHTIRGAGYVLKDGR